MRERIFPKQGNICTYRLNSTSSAKSFFFKYKQNFLRILLFIFYVFFLSFLFALWTIKKMMTLAIYMQSYYFLLCNIFRLHKISNIYKNQIMQPIFVWNLLYVLLFWIILKHCCKISPSWSIQYWKVIIQVHSFNINAS